MLVTTARPTARRPRARRRATGTAAAALVLAAAALSGCDAGQSLAAGGDPDPTSSGAASAGADPSSDATPDSSATLDSSIAKGSTDVTVDTPLQLSATAGTLTAVRVSGSGDAGELTGTIADGTWSSTGRLEPGATYTVKADLTDGAGKDVVRRTGFSTQDLTLAEQTYPSVAPLEGETVGVGMPVIVTFDVPVLILHARSEERRVV